MKQFLLSLIAMIGISTMLSSQTIIVDTLPSKRKVILEEFTGIKCGFCPDGHKISQQLMDAVPGKVFAINIHTGGYATPSAGQPDFRTPWGSAIAGQSGLTGYPAGTINRHVFSGHQQGSGTAMSRGSWATTAAQIYAQPSYLNVAVEGDIDTKSRDIRVHVQVYFTSNGATTNNLSVALLQDNLEGPQSGMSGNPSQILPNGNYNHTHMLRHLFTGQWGITLPNTSAGSLFDTTITYTLPLDYNGVPVNLADLNLVAFVAEGQQEIISGNSSHPTIDGATGVNDVAENKMKVYPNPTSGLLNIENIQGANIEIYNLMGELVYSNINASNFETIDLSNHVSGTYFVRAITDKSSFSRTIIVK